MQVGAGVSTAVILRAARDAAYSPEIICVDPIPTSYLAARGAHGEVEVVGEPAQEVNASVLVNIDEGDLLFVDSTHTVKPGTEVNRVVFETLPRRARSVWVHFHDIWFPFYYSRGLMTDDLLFWEESALVLAFLVGKPTFAVRASMSMLHYERTAELRALLPSYVPQENDGGLRRTNEGHFPSSMFMQAVSARQKAGETGT